MKNYLTLFLLAAAIATTSAQIQKGSVLIGGTIGFNNFHEEGNGFSIVNISPAAGFFLSNRFVLGANLQYSVLIADDNTSSTLGLTPFVRYYFNGSGQARFFGQAELGFQVDGSFNGDPEAIFGLGAGVDFFLNDHVAIEAVLGYLRYQDPEVESGYNNIGFNIGVAAFIGGGKGKE